jgi:hypothetical protein
MASILRHSISRSSSQRTFSLAYTSSSLLNKSTFGAKYSFTSLGPFLSQSAGLCSRTTTASKCVSVPTKAFRPIEQPLSGFLYRREFSTTSARKVTINQAMRRKKKSPKDLRRSKSASPYLEDSPQKKGVCVSLIIKKPKKPNSADRWVHFSFKLFPLLERVPTI